MKRALRTPLCERLGMWVPIVQAPIGSATTPELAAAVAEAGGLGMLAISWVDADEAAAQFRKAHDLSRGAIGVNACLDFPVRDRVIAALAAGCRIVSTFWGDPRELHGLIAEAGAIHLHTVGTPAEAEDAVRAGVDVVVAQGWEAGGHLWGRMSSLPLVPAVVDAVDPVPVIAAGGIADGRGVAAALVLGAQAAWLGTRFIAAAESAAHPQYRARVVAARAVDTVDTNCFDGGWPRARHRVIRNETLQHWEEAGRPASSRRRPGDHDILARRADGRNVARYDDVAPLAGMTGDVEQMALYAGQSVGLVHDVRPAGEIVAQLLAEADAALSRPET